jgi:hypothetical protein
MDESPALAIMGKELGFFKDPLLVVSLPWVGAMRSQCDEAV